MSKKLEKFIFFVFLILGDLLAFYLSLFMAYLTRLFINPLVINYADFKLPLSHFLKMWWIPVIFVFFYFYEGLYHKRYPFPEELRRIVKAVFISTVALFFLVGFTKSSEDISRLMFLILGLCIPLPTAFFRSIVKNSLFKRGIGLKRFAVVGTDGIAVKSASFLSAEKHLGYAVVGFFGDKEVFKSISLNGKTFKVRKLKFLKKLIDRGLVDCIVVSTGYFKDEEDIARFVYSNYGKVRELILVPPLKGVSLVNSEPMHIYMLDVFMLKFKDNLSTFPNIYIKRIFDLTLSLLALPLVLLLTAVISVLIKLETKGPVFFSHTRVGKDGKPIKVYKFRTMYMNAQDMLEKLLMEREELRHEWNMYGKLKDDPRITRVGRFLRRTSLDELPQIFNVIKGDMSLVGPRPVTQEELDKYYGEFAQVYKMVKPGITGYWQVSGRNDVDYSTRVAMDTFYVINWSLWLDLYILAKTFWVVIKKQGAY
ncbi:MAG: undecaprenyl-phosphate galactose phosphotransferase WbaP [Hydrogenobacter sp.]